jgi:hypothetical protein
MNTKRRKMEGGIVIREGRPLKVIYGEVFEWGRNRERGNFYIAIIAGDEFVTAETNNPEDLINLKRAIERYLEKYYPEKLHHEMGYM